MNQTQILILCYSQIKEILSFLFFVTFELLVSIKLPFSTCKVKLNISFAFICLFLTYFVPQLISQPNIQKWQCEDWLPMVRVKGCCTPLYAEDHKEILAENNKIAKAKVRTRNTLFYFFLGFRYDWTIKITYLLVSVTASICYGDTHFCHCIAHNNNNWTE